MPKGWIIPRVWKGPVHIIGGGPSLENFDFERFRGKRLITINNAYEDVPFAQFCYFMDFSWWKFNKEKIRNFGGIMITTCSLVEDRFVKFVPPTMDEKLGNNQKSMMRGRCSGQGAIGLAVKLGGNPIFLHGYDMKVSDTGKHNYHSRHHRTVQEGNYVNRFLPQFPAVKQQLDKLGIEVFNATPDSALKVFGFISPEKALEH